MAVKGNTATAAKKKPRGKPFVSGDSRSNRNGQRSKAVVEFSRNLRELLVSEGETVEDRRGLKLKRVEHLARKVWDEAVNGRPWAVEFIADRVEGKVTQPVGGDPDHPLEFILREVLTDGSD